jgi:hypothetical protein
MMERRQAAGKQGTVRNETRDVRHETKRETVVHETGSARLLSLLLPDALGRENFSLSRGIKALTRRDAFAKCNDKRCSSFLLQLFNSLPAPNYQ